MPAPENGEGGLEEQGLELNIKHTCFRQSLLAWAGPLPPPDSIPKIPWCGITFIFPLMTACDVQFILMLTL